MAELKLVNESSNTFADISSEESRTYRFPGGDLVTIARPQWLSVSTSGHRLLDGAGVSHYVPKGWVHLSWKARDGMPHFVK